MKKKKIALRIFLIILLGLAGFGIYVWYRLDKPTIIKSFPNPFEFNNGSKVKTEDDWLVRRQEIKELLLDEEYGHMPGRPDAITAKEKDSEKRDDGSVFKTIQLSLIPSNSSPNDKIKFTVWMYIPDDKGPFPTIVKVSADGTGSQTEMNEIIVDRGYLYVCYNHTELDLDTSGYDEDGPCQKAYPKKDWGSIAVWAWGAMRVADYLLGEPWVDAPDGFPDVDNESLIITGHSRRGKTALLAGALDERFTMVVPNGAGCGGTGSFLVQGIFCETIASITSESLYKSWFHEDFGKYAGNEIDLDFDQHFLRALVAPRIVLSTDATCDLWANPTGTQAIYEATIPVFKFLGVKKNNAIHYRAGGHAFTEEDFEILLDFADKMLLDKDVSGDFYMTPYDFEAPIEYNTPK